MGLVAKSVILLTLLPLTAVTVVNFEKWAPHAIASSAQVATQAPEKLAYLAPHKLSLQKCAVEDCSDTPQQGHDF